METWLITGGAGFIGCNLALHIRKSNPATHLACYDNFTAGSIDDARSVGYDTIIQGDILDKGSVDDAVASADVVVHLAAQTGVPSSLKDPLHDLTTNIVGSFNVLDGAARSRPRKVILASSAAPIGDASPPMRETTLPKPISPYGASKLAMEAYAHVYGSTADLDTLCLRFSNVYGPLSYHKGSVVARFYTDILRIGSVHINGDGEQTRDFVYVDDICSAIYDAGTTDTVAPVLQLGTGIETSVNTLAELVFRSLDMEPKVNYSAPLTGDVQRNFADIGLAKSELGYRPVTSLNQGLSNTAAWFRDSTRFNTL